MQAATQAHGSARGDVEVGEFLAGELGRGINRCSCFVYDGVAQLGGRLRDEFRHHFFGFAACRAVADDDGVDAVAFDQGIERLLRSFDIAARRGGVDRGVIEQFAELVEHGYLAARAVSGVERDDARAFYGTLLKKTLGVFGEDADGVGLCSLGELAAQLAFERRGYEAFVTVCNRLVERFGEDPVASGNAAAQLADRGVLV